jgi:type IV pilus assembly protein PilB
MKSVLDLLVDKEVIKSGDATLIMKDAAGDPLKIEERLVSSGVTLDQLLSLLSEFYAMPYRVLTEEGLPESTLAYIPEESAKHYKMVPLGVSEGVLEVGIVDPDNIEATDALQFIAHKHALSYKLFIISSHDFEKVMNEYENLTGEVGEALSQFESVDEKEKEMLTKEKKSDIVSEEEVIKATAPVTKIVQTILRYAVEGNASDIHIEPTLEKTKVRFRMDGILHTSLELPNKIHPAVVARIKILAQMRLDEKRKPQDGRFSAKIEVSETSEKKNIDFRVSTFPTQHGEKVVMRILDRSKSAITLASLGLEGDHLEKIKTVLQAPYGIILICGPTGSGKSTTLYAMLSELDRETKNVVSVEDPVEYEIPGVAQSQVHPEIGYTFAAGLRSILRQDPDIVMVGEIRDKETAQLAIQAALTGHLVFSTLHTNNAAGAIPRLLDMGVDPYLIAPTLVAAIGQRLVRKLCDGAGKEVQMHEATKVMIQKQFEDLPEKYRSSIPELKTYYEAAPTADCPTGMRGRTGVFEFFMVDPDIEKAILENPVEEKLYAVARSKGMITLKEDAIIKALKGEIPFEEVNSLGGEILLEDKLEE